MPRRGWGGLALSLGLQLRAFAEEGWPACDNRAYRDEEVEPGGLKLLGVQESPLGGFPTVAAAATHEHFFQQLREVWSDDCPRVMVQLGLQPAPGRWRNWTAAALWLRYFNHSGIVLLADAVEDHLEHAAAGLRAALSGDSVRVVAVKAALAAEGRPRVGERPVSFDAPGGAQVAAADEVMRACTGGALGAEVGDEAHPCSRVLQRMGLPDPLEYVAPIRSFDDIWKNELAGHHADFLHVDLGAASMLEMFRKGFAQIVKERQISVLAFRVDELWTKAALGEVVKWLDLFEYFSLFRLVCANSSQAGDFAYRGPGGVGPTTYLPISGVDFDRAVDWDRMPLPQDVLALDLRQPDLFRTVQLGDAQCDADEAGAEASGEDGACAAGDPESCRGSAAEAAAPPQRPQQVRVLRSEARALTLQWRAHPEGPRPEGYLLRVEPGAQELALEHDAFGAAAGLQSHTVGGLQPDSEYTLSLRASGPAGASTPAVLTHRTEREEAPAATSAYEVVAGLHCGMTPAEEVQPPGPPPQGTSFFRDTADVDGCRARCDDDRRCVAFQVKAGDACWLYRQRPRPERLTGPRADADFFCGVRQAGW